MPPANSRRQSRWVVVMSIVPDVVPYHLRRSAGRSASQILSPQGTGAEACLFSKHGNARFYADRRDASGRSILHVYALLELSFASDEDE